jgi:thymidylate synthase
MKLNAKIKNLFDFSIEDFELKDYLCDTSIKAPISI